MKIAVSAKGTSLDSSVDPRFGRAAYILVVDTASLGVEVLDNSDNVDAFKGAGIQTAAKVSEKGAEAVLTGFCGPKAFETLQAAGVKVANNVSGTVREAVAAFNEGRLSFADTANAEAHW